MGMSRDRDGQVFPRERGQIAASVPGRSAIHRGAFGLEKYLFKLKAQAAVERVNYRRRFPLGEAKLSFNPPY